MKSLLALNWKMAPEKPTDAIRLAKSVAALSKKYKKNISFIACPPFVHLAAVAKASKAFRVGGQLVAADSTEAQTGLISAGMLKASGAQYCIVGHSEARARGENNEVVAQQIARLVEKKIIPIACVGERARDTQGWYLSEVKDQVESILSALPRAALRQLIIAYEPVWAIGVRAERVATPAECREMIIYIRKVIADTCGAKASESVTIVYGGSVDEKNARTFLTEGAAQGHLVGRASLDVKRLGALAASLIT